MGLDARARRRLAAGAGVLAALALASCGPSGARPDPNTFRCQVIGVTDGDTLTVREDGGRKVTVRVAEIDAPERGQPWSRQSTAALAGLAADRAATVHGTGTDRYGRTVGRVTVAGRDVGRAMVESGAAWAFRKYLTDTTLIATEATARQARRGLWSLPAAETTAPWDWRAGVRPAVGVRTAAVAAAPAPTPPRGLLDTTEDAGFRCGARHYCKEMRSCAEARFHLIQCGLSRLDQDDDGQPCEAICAAPAT